MSVRAMIASVRFAPAQCTAEALAFVRSARAKLAFVKSLASSQHSFIEASEKSAEVSVALRNDASVTVAELKRALVRSACRKLATLRSTALKSQPASLSYDPNQMPRRL